MNNPYKTLGVPDNCSKDEARKAYRKLAMQHHPDRGGDEAVFKELKLAWESIDTGWKQPQQSAYSKPKRSTSFSEEFNKTNQAKHNGEHAAFKRKFYNTDDINDIFNDFKTNTGPKSTRFNQNEGFYQEYGAKVSMRQAFLGFHFQIPKIVNINGMTTNNIFVPGGAFPGHSMIVAPGVKVNVQFTDTNFKMRGLDSEFDSPFTASLLAGDIEVEKHIDAIDLITGAWITIQDFLGEDLRVRIPEGFDPQRRLKIANKGYASWSVDTGPNTEFRQHMFVKVIPVFNKPSNIERDKIINLYKSIQEK
jgi:DnaJ-class molecular chaperone